MNTDISPEQSAFIDQQVAQGAFPDRKHALDAAVELLRQQTHALELLDTGRQQLDDGQFLEYDDAGLRRRFEELKDRAAGRIEADSSGP